MRQVKFGSPQRILKWEQWMLQTFILDEYERVVTKKSVQRIFGHNGKSDWLSEFMEAFQRFDILPPQLLLAIKKPLLIKVAKPSGTFTIEEGYLIQTLFEICDFIISANEAGYLNVLELKIAKTAKKITDCNKTSPLALQIDETTGFNFYKENALTYFIDYLQLYENEIAYAWVQSFPSHFWSALLAFFKTDWENLRVNPQQLALFVHKNIFGRLPRVLFEHLSKTHPKRSYRLKKPRLQTGINDLDQYIAFVILLLQSSSGSEIILEQLLENSFSLVPAYNAPSFGEITHLKTAQSNFDIFVQKVLK